MKHLTTILAAVLCAVCLSGCENNGNIKVVDKYEIYTDTIRGHVYLHIYGGGILHDPDCPCHKNNPELLNEK